MCCLYVFLFVYVYDVVCDFVHDCESVCLSAFLELIHIYLFSNLGCDASGSGVIVCNEPGSSNIDPLELVPILFCVGVPYSCTVLQCWSNKCVVSYVFNVWCAVV